jgi:predicted double-glycine peptidase
MKTFFLLSIAFFLFISDASGYEKGAVKMESWKEIRDKGVVKQKEDDTCGAAALATVLQMYGTFVTEAEILKETAKGGWLSFEDVHRAAVKRGFRSAGFAGKLDLLQRLKYPTIVFLVSEHGGEHFSVVYEMSEKWAYLADPSLGRVKMELSRFDTWWHTREGSLYGRFLLILPKEGEEAAYKGLDLQGPLYGNAIALRDFIRFH